MKAGFQGPATAKQSMSAPLIEDWGYRPLCVKVYELPMKKLCFSKQEKKKLFHVHIDPRLRCFDGLDINWGKGKKEKQIPSWLKYPFIIYAG